MSMRFRTIDGNNDWSFGAGLSSYSTDEQAINLNIRTRLQTFLGECFFALQAGVDWWNLIGGKNPAAQQGLVLQCRTVIINSYGVVRIQTVTPVLNTRSRHLTVNYAVDTIFTRNLLGSVQFSS